MLNMYLSVCLSACACLSLSLSQFRTFYEWGGTGANTHVTQNTLPVKGLQVIHIPPTHTHNNYKHTQ